LAKFLHSKAQSTDRAGSWARDVGIGATKVAVDYNTGWYITESQGGRRLKNELLYSQVSMEKIITLQIIGAILYPTTGLK